MATKIAVATAKELSQAAANTPWTHSRFDTTSIRANKQLQAVLKVRTNSDNPEAWSVEMAKLLGVTEFSLSEDSAEVWKRVDVQRFPDASAAEQYLLATLVHSNKSPAENEGDQRLFLDALWGALITKTEELLGQPISNEQALELLSNSTGYGTPDEAWAKGADLAALKALIGLAKVGAPNVATVDPYEEFANGLTAALERHIPGDSKPARKLQVELLGKAAGVKTRKEAFDTGISLDELIAKIDSFVRDDKIANDKLTLAAASQGKPLPPKAEQPPRETPRESAPKRRSNNPFQPAATVDSYLRLALTGISGSGKTATALALATALKPNARIAVIDTENGSAAKYRKSFNFDVCHVNNHDPRAYLELLTAAEDNGYDVVIIDSFSHEWMAEGGVLDIHDDLTERKYKGNSFAAWKDIKPTHNRLIQALQQVKMHVIVTMRVKSEWRIEENDRGKQVPVRVGLATIQGEGVEYEFDVVGSIGSDHLVSIEKTRCPTLDRTSWNKPAELGAVLANWLIDMGDVGAVA